MGWPNGNFVNNRIVILYIFAAFLITTDMNKNRKKENNRREESVRLLKWIITIGLEILFSGASINIYFNVYFC